MVRYPIFRFYDDDSLVVYEAPGDWTICEPEDLKDVSIVFDRDGRVLTPSEGNDAAVRILDSGEEPDRERLRLMLIQALQRKGQAWASDAPLDSLIEAAREAYRYGEGIPVSEAVGNLLRFLRLKKRRP